MSGTRYVAVLGTIAATTFLVAFGVTRQRQRDAVSATAPEPLAPDAPDSLQLKAIGLAPGRQLVAYVFGGSRCGHCRRPEVKQAIGALRDSLKALHGRDFTTIATVGVAINTDVEEGLAYLRSIGLSAFDEISIGKGWQNEEVIRWIRRGKTADSAVPLIIVLTRRMSATLTPLTVKYSPDTVVAVLQGTVAIVDWLAQGAPIRIGSKHKRAKVSLDRVRALRRSGDS